MVMGRRDDGVGIWWRGMGNERGNARRTDASTCNYEIIAVAHALYRLDDLALVVGYDLDPFERLACTY